VDAIKRLALVAAQTLLKRRTISKLPGIIQKREKVAKLKNYGTSLFCFCALKDGLENIYESSNGVEHNATTFHSLHSLIDPKSVDTFASEDRQTPLTTLAFELSGTNYGINDRNKKVLTSLLTFS
jgi:hypothetical protein